MKAILFALGAMIATPALAQTCPPAPPLTAGADAASAPALKAGEAVTLALRPAPQVHFSVPARRGDDARTFGGVAAFTVAAAGIYRVGLGSGAWIEVAQDGAGVKSGAHSHGEACITKMVDFPLKPGRAVIELSAATEETIRLQVAPAP